MFRLSIGAGCKLNTFYLTCKERKGPQKTRVSSLFGPLAIRVTQALFSRITPAFPFVTRMQRLHLIRPWNEMYIFSRWDVEVCLLGCTYLVGRGDARLNLAAIVLQDVLEGIGMQQENRIPQRDHTRRPPFSTGYLLLWWALMQHSSPHIDVCFCILSANLRPSHISNRFKVYCMRFSSRQYHHMYRANSYYCNYTGAQPWGVIFTVTGNSRVRVAQAHDDHRTLLKV